MLSLQVRCRALHKSYPKIPTKGQALQCTVVLTDKQYRYVRYWLRADGKLLYSQHSHAGCTTAELQVNQYKSKSFYGSNMVLCT